MAEGDFSATALSRITLRAQQMWTTNTTQAPEANVVTVRTVMENQTATLTELEDRTKDKSVRITWVDACALAVRDCTPDCEITGPTAGTLFKDYDLDLCQEVSFSVDEFTFRTQSGQMEDVVAPLLNNAIAALDGWYNTQTLLRLKTFAGVNAVPAPYTYAAGTTTIPSAAYNRTIIANLIFQAMRNKFNNPYFINNGDLYVDFLNAQFDAGNAAGAGDKARIDALRRMVYDLDGFYTAGLTESIFVVNPAAVAVATKVRNPVAPRKLVDVTEYTVPSRSLPGVTYDAFYQIKCQVIGGESHYLHSWKLKTRGGIFLNPAGCPVSIGGATYTPTGVLSYTRG